MSPASKVLIPQTVEQVLRDIGLNLGEDIVFFPEIPFRRLLNMLPRDQRIALTLKLDGRSWPVIMRAVGLSRDEAGRLIVRARYNLKRLALHYLQYAMNGPP